MKPDAATRAFVDIDMSAPPPDRDLQAFEQLSSYVQQERIPWLPDPERLNTDLRAHERYTERNLGRPFPLRKSIYVPRRIFQDALKSRFSADLTDSAIYSLARAAPEASARRLLTTHQKFLGAAMILSAAICFAAAPLGALIGFNVIATAYFIAAILFRLYLTVIGLSITTPPAAAALSDDDLPVVTILLPVYDEAEGLAHLAASMEALDYPPDKLDIKLIMEEDDVRTRNAALALGLDARFDCVAVPASEPRTKPKACNYALPLARGDLVVIYDAEDEPEPDQLRKAAAAFAAAPENVVCLQARLNYYNNDENWLTRLFALEYALWFDLLLPALEKLRVPIPLGGTSNIFRTGALIELGGWDPFNVTEDADLGLRLARAEYETRVLDSTTYEEANCRTPNWIRQRSRWMKGYMQTWLVHMRAPLFAAGGLRGFVATQLFVAGNVFSALVNPLLWALFILWFASGAAIISEIFPGPLLSLNLFALLFGNSFFIYLFMIAPAKRGWISLAPAALLAPIYWALTSLAAYKAVWQLFTRPSFWEKTDHMLSAQARPAPGRSAGEGAGRDRGLVR